MCKEVRANVRSSYASGLEINQENFFVSYSSVDLPYSQGDPDPREVTTRPQDRVRAPLLYSRVAATYKCAVCVLCDRQPREVYMHVIVSSATPMWPPVHDHDTACNRALSCLSRGTQIVFNLSVVHLQVEHHASDAHASTWAYIINKGGVTFQKHRSYLSFLASNDSGDDDIVVAVDAWDVMAVRRLSTNVLHSALEAAFLAAAKSTDRTRSSTVTRAEDLVLFSGECQCWPTGNFRPHLCEAQLLAAPAGAPYPYLNTGVFVGRRRAVLAFLQAVREVAAEPGLIHKRWHTDQAIIHRLCFDVAYLHKRSSSHFYCVVDYTGSLSRTTFGYFAASAERVGHLTPNATCQNVTWKSALRLAPCLTPSHSSSLRSMLIAGNAAMSGFTDSSLCVTDALSGVQPVLWHFNSKNQMMCTLKMQSWMMSQLRLNTPQHAERLRNARLREWIVMAGQTLQVRDERTFGEACGAALQNSRRATIGLPKLRSGLLSV